MTAWLIKPSITVIARNRGAGNKQAATDGLPDAVQIADRLHPMKNASSAFLDAVRQSMYPIRKAVGVGAVDPASQAPQSADSIPDGCFAMLRTQAFWR